MYRLFRPSKAEPRIQRLVPGDIRDLDQVRASLHRTRHEAGAQRMAAKRGWIEAETGSTLLHDRRTIPRREAPLDDALGALVEALHRAVAASVQGLLALIDRRSRHRS